MNLEDLAFAQNYFSQKRRNPTVAEIKVLDTYRSDHCRHTTFNTELGQIDFAENIKHYSLDAAEILNDIIYTQLEYEQVRREL